jgi:hypothetical protein
MNIKAIHNHIIFTFIDNVNSDGQFEEITSGGLVLLGHFDNSAKTSRWANIISLGPDCSTYLKKKGCQILIENLKWTSGIMFEDQMVWRTDESKVLAYRYPD